MSEESAVRTRRMETGFLGAGRRRDQTIPLPRDPHLPAPYDTYDHASVQALWNGEADAHQQRRALEWIVFTAGGGALDSAYVPGDDKATYIKLGKQMVAKEIMKLVFLKQSGADQSEQGR